MVIEQKKIVWTAPEYEHKEKHPDWFWALGIITVSATIASIIYKNYLFAIFIILATFLLALISVRKPKTLEFEVNEEGILIEDTFYPYQKLQSFWLDRSDEKNLNLLIHTDRVFMPVLTIPLKNVSGDEIEKIIKNHLKKESLHEPLLHKFMEFIGI